MRLFLRDQLPLILIYIGQLVIVSLVYWLGGMANVRLGLYAAFLSLCLLLFYLIFRYLRNRAFYQRLEKPFTSMEDLTEMKVGWAPLTQSLRQLMHSQLQHYRTLIYDYKHRLENHIQFINQWVHQMKTPISVIYLMIQNEDDPRLREIGDELDRLKKGLEMVLYTSRLDKFEQDFYVETLRLERIVRNVTSEQKRLFIRKHVFPSIEINSELSIASDEKWLSFVLTQIVTNAIRYTTQENQKIYFRGYKHGMNSVLEIQDEGIGIPESDLPRIFNPYFTGENGRNFQESTGMGLYLVKQICDKLGIGIEIESKVNVGTTVRLTF